MINRSLKYRMLWLGCLFVLANACQEDELAPADVTPTVEDEPKAGEAVFRFSSMPTALRVDMEGAVRNIAVTSVAYTDSIGRPLDYTIGDYPDWVTVSKDSIGNLQVLFSENEGITERDGVISIYQDSLDNELEIPVSQRVVIFPEVATDAPLPPNAGRRFVKNFQSVGYGSKVITAALIGRTRNECTTDLLTSAVKSVTYVEKYYDDNATEEMLITYTDAGLFFNCDNVGPAGQVTKGYVLFDKQTSRDGAASPSIEIAARPSISIVRFSLSATSLEGRGLALYQSVDGGDYEPVGLFKPKQVNKGETFSVPINRANVALKFAPVGKSGYFRMHDLSVYAPPFEHDGELIIEDNFQDWNMLGYISSSTTDQCGWLLKAAGTMFSARSDKNYSRWLVNYLLYDAGLNPSCGSDAGSSTDNSEVSTGYVTLQAPIYYACGGHTSWSKFEISELPSVSKVQFSFSYSLAHIEKVYGLILCKKTPNDPLWVKIGDCTIDGDTEAKTQGKVVTIDVNEERVRLAFLPKWPLYNGTDITPTPDGSTMQWHNELIDVIPVNTSRFDGTMRIHDLKVWSMKKD